jgi:hypothetical protein
MRRRSLEGIDALAGVETEERMKKGLNCVFEGFKYIKTGLIWAFLQIGTAKDRSNQRHVIKYGALQAPVTVDETLSSI